MKISFPLIPLSNYDRFNNLMQIACSYPKSQTISGKNSGLINIERPVNHHLSLRDIASEYMPKLIAKIDSVMPKGNK